MELRELRKITKSDFRRRPQSRRPRRGSVPFPRRPARLCAGGTGHGADPHRRAPASRCRPTRWWRRPRWPYGGKLGCPLTGGIRRDRVRSAAPPPRPSPASPAAAPAVTCEAAGGRGDPGGHGGPGSAARSRDSMAAAPPRPAANGRRPPRGPIGGHAPPAPTNQRPPRGHSRRGLKGQAPWWAPPGGGAVPGRWRRHHRRMAALPLGAARRHHELHARHGQPHPGHRQ